ncbi:MAG: cytochrome C [Deltaproteobacteria bacterium]|nr:cytochrome C [Deltaproteobacteria bacterium]
MLLVPALSMAQLTYQKDVRPIMEAKCSNCHGPQTPLVDEFKKDKDKFVKQNKGPRMDSYSLLLEFVKGKDAGAIMRRLDDGKSKDDKKPGNMYIYLGKDEEERQKNLKVFKEWVGSWNLKRKADLTPEESKKVTAPQ